MAVVYMSYPALSTFRHLDERILTNRTFFIKMNSRLLFDLKSIFKKEV